METRKLLPLLALVLSLALAATVWYYPPTGDFRTDNPFWNGLSTLSQQPRVQPLDSLRNLPANPRGTALVMVPYIPLTESELTQIKSYIENGGTLVLLDDYGYGNQTLTSLGTDMSFTGKPLLDPLFDYHNKWLPKITDFAVTPLKANVSSIVFNHATSLQPSNATVIAYSSSFSFIDANGNGLCDTNETSGAQPVAAYTKLGQGCIVAVADPSLLINSMINLDDNLQFLNNAAAIQSSNPQIYIDQQHLPTTALDDAKTNLTTLYTAVASPMGTVGLIALLLIVTTYPTWKKVTRT